MVARTRNDQVFQLSLTEIAFTIVFILLLLLGYLVYREQIQREEAELALAKTRGAEASAAAMQAAMSAFSEALAAAGAKPESLDSIIAKISAGQDVRDERDRLKKQIEDLDAQLSAMTELQKLIEVAAAKKDVALDEVISALMLKDQVKKELEKQLHNSNSTDDVKSTGALAAQLPLQSSEERGAKNKEMLQQVKEALRTAELLKSALKKQLDQTLKTGKEAEVIDEVVAAARIQLELAKGGSSIEAVKKENADLRGQVAFYKRRLEARGGRDYPPCWATETGSPEYLFSVELMPTGVNVQPSWPSNREADAMALPGINAALQTPVSLDAFVANVQGIFNASRNADPQCRHYVYLKSTIADAVASDRARLTVEKYFYKNEARR